MDLNNIGQQVINRLFPTEYPPVGFHFSVLFDFGVGKGTSSEMEFQEVSGLSKEVTTEEFIEGGENRFTYRFPKGTKYSNLILRRGMKPKSDVIDWARDAIDHFQFRPADITVTLLNPDHQPLVIWKFQKCWPLKWSTSDLKAMDNAVVIETLELNYRYYEQTTA